MQAQKKPQAGNLRQKKRSDNIISIPESTAKIKRELVDPVYFSRVTSERPRILAKRYNLDESCGLHKLISAQMIEGFCETCTCSSLTEFAKELISAHSNQSFMYGISRHDSIGILSMKEYNTRGNPDGYIPRIKEHFVYPNSSGILFFDYDGTSLGRDDLCCILWDCLGSVSMIWWTSSSSHICNGDEDLTGLKGQRLYVIVKDASDIPRAAQVLQDRLWLLDQGHIFISKSGGMYPRTVFDSAVYQSNRLDFVAGAVCSPPLTQRRGEPEIIPGDIERLDTREALPDLTEEEMAQVVRLKEQGKAESRSEAERVRREWIEVRTGEDLERNPDKDPEEVRAVFSRAAEHGTLHGDYAIVVVSGAGRETVTVAEILDNPERYHRKRTLDPLEPEYGDQRQTGILYLYGGRPTLFSQAHGGRTYRLARQPRRIEVKPGHIHEAIQDTLAVMQKEADFFNHGDQPVVLDGGRMLPLGVDLLAFRLGGPIQYYEVRGSNEKIVEIDKDPPQKICRALPAMGGSCGLKPLRGIVTAPVMRQDGSILIRPGYDEQTGLFLDTMQTISVLEKPTVRQCEIAVGQLWQPFELFPWTAPLDRSVCLAAILSAIQRAVLPTCPGFGFDASAQGSGKTKLAECIGVIATGHRPAIMPHTTGRDDEETRKRIFACLAQGKRVLVWDNVTGMFDSASLAAMLTSETVTDRILGQSRTTTLPNNLLFLMTGNNLCLSGDMPRRILTCRIEPKTDRPYAREFPWDPMQVCMARRQQLVQAGLTLLQGYRNSEEFQGRHRLGSGRMASFETWDDQIRQTVLWVGKHIKPGVYGDVMDAVDVGTGLDPEAETFLEFLQAWCDLFGDQALSAKEVLAWGTFERGEKRKAFEEALVGLTGQADCSARTLGRYLSNRRGRIVDGLSIQPVGGGAKKTKKWKVQQPERAV